MTENNIIVDLLFTLTAVSFLAGLWLIDTVVTGPAARGRREELQLKAGFFLLGVFMFLACTSKYWTGWDVGILDAFQMTAHVPFILGGTLLAGSAVNSGVTANWQALAVGVSMTVLGCFMVANVADLLGL